MLLAISSHNTSPKILVMGPFNLVDYVNENLAVTMCHKGVNVYLIEWAKKDIPHPDYIKCTK